MVVLDQNTANIARWIESERAELESQVRLDKKASTIAFLILFVPLGSIFGLLPLLMFSWVGIPFAGMGALMSLITAGSISSSKGKETLRLSQLQELESSLFLYLENSNRQNLFYQKAQAYGLDDLKVIQIGEMFSGPEMTQIQPNQERLQG